VCKTRNRFKLGNLRRVVGVWVMDALKSATRTGRDCIRITTNCITSAGPARSCPAADRLRIACSARFAANPVQRLDQPLAKRPCQERLRRRSQSHSPCPWPAAMQADLGDKDGRDICSMGRPPVGREASGRIRPWDFKNRPEAGGLAFFKDLERSGALRLDLGGTGMTVLTAGWPAEIARAAGDYGTA